MSVKSHPFQFIPRWRDIGKFDDNARQLLEERDRELEDYLGSLSPGGAALTDMISLSRATTQSATDTFLVDFAVTDYATGASKVTYSSVSVIQIDVAGTWHISANAFAPGSGAGATQPYLYRRRSSTNTALVIPASQVAGNGAINCAVDAVLQVNDLIFVEFTVAGFDSQNVVVQVPATLQAFRIA
jgi:hypothetical protein